MQMMVLDEISIAAENICLLSLKMAISVAIKSSQKIFHVSAHRLMRLKLMVPEQSLAMIKGVLDNQAGAARDIVALNAGATIYVSGIADSLKAGIEKSFFCH